tara:strand:- start:19 stop:315 length:297 start_codon:yes stop_codon:yes gene_type:complete
MTWKDDIKKNESEIEDMLTDLKDRLRDALSYKPEDVKNEQGQFIREEVEHVLSAFSDTKYAIRRLTKELAEYGETLGVWDGSYGYDYLPSGDYTNEGD